MAEATQSQLVSNHVIDGHPKDFPVAEEKLSHPIILEAGPLPESGLDCILGKANQTDKVPLKGNLSVDEMPIRDQKDAIEFKSESTKLDHQHDVWRCRQCGWTYPNAHPSAKHRRNHKKVCGKTKAFEMGGNPAGVGGSSDEASSDEKHSEHTEYQEVNHWSAPSVEPACVISPCIEQVHAMSPEKGILKYESGNGSQMDGIQLEEATKVPNLSVAHNGQSLNTEHIEAGIGMNSMEDDWKKFDHVSGEKILRGEILKEVLLDSSFLKEISNDTEGQPRSTLQQPFIPLESEITGASTFLGISELKETEDVGCLSSKSRDFNQELSVKPQIVTGDHGAAIKVERLPPDCVESFKLNNDKEPLCQIALNEEVFDKVMPHDSPQRCILPISAVPETGSSTMAEAELWQTDQLACDIGSFQQVNELQCDISAGTSSVELEMGDLEVGSQKKEDTVEAESIGKGLPDMARLNLAESPDPDFIEALNQGFVVEGKHHTAAETPKTVKSMSDHDIGRETNMVNLYCMKEEIIDKKPKIRGNERDCLGDSVQESIILALQEDQSSVTAVLNETNSVSWEDNGLIGKKASDSPSLEKSSNGELYKVEKPEQQAHEEERQLAAGVNGKMPKSDSIVGLSETSECAEMIASIPKEVDTVGDTEAFVDALESLETCSVGASVDENESVDGTIDHVESPGDKKDSHSFSERRVKEGTSQLTAALGYEVDVGQSSFPEQKGLETGLDSTVPPHVIDKASMTDLKCEDGIQTSKSRSTIRSLSISNVLDFSYDEDLKAPSPEAWQEPETFQDVREDTVHKRFSIQEVVPENDMELQAGQMAKRTHTPLSSLLAKESTELDELNRKDSTALMQKGVKTVEGVWGSPISVRKPKSKSIWSHCTCCPSVH